MNIKKEIIRPIYLGKIDMGKYLTIERKKEIEKSRNEINGYLNNCDYCKKISQSKD